MTEREGEEEIESERERKRERGREGEMPDEINLICPIYRKKIRISVNQVGDDSMKTLLLVKVRPTCIWFQIGRDSKSERLVSTCPRCHKFGLVDLKLRILKNNLGPCNLQTHGGLLDGCQIAP